MAKKTKVEQEKSFHQELIQQMVTLSTSGFGLVAALAWNEAIQQFVNDYINKFFPDQSSVIAKFIYALIITLFAVLITYQLSKAAAKFTTPKD